MAPKAKKKEPEAVKATQYTYRSIPFGGANTDEIAALGQEGWRLVAVHEGYAILEKVE
jgi:hypothetical protein